MSIAELMNEIRKLPDVELLTLAARAVDHQSAARVQEGDFDELAAWALREYTIPMTGRPCRVLQS